MQALADALPENQVRRPGLGTRGRKIPIKVNAFLARIPDLTVHHYDIAIIPHKSEARSHGGRTAEPSAEPTRLPPRVGREVFAYLNRVLNAFSGTAAVFDGRKNIYAPKKIPNWPHDEGYYEVNIAQEGERERKFTVKIVKVGQVRLNALHRFLEGQDGPTADEGVLMAINALNVLVNHDVLMRHPSTRSKFYPNPYGQATPDYLSLPGGLHLWRGYFSSLRLCPRVGSSHGLLLNFDLTSQPFFAHGNAVQVALLLADAGTNPRELLQLRPLNRLAMERGLKSLKVKVRRHDGRTFIVKKVLEVSRVGADNLMFNNGNERMSVANYVHTEYNNRLRYPDLPCLRLTQRAWYPLELCEVPQGQKYSRKLSPDQLRKAIEWQTIKPEPRMIKLLDSLRANFHPSISPSMGSWGLQMKPEPLQATARVLVSPKVLLKDSQRKTEAPVELRDGSWNMIRKQVCHPGRPVKDWMVVVFSKPNRSFSQHELDVSLRCFVQGLTTTGIAISPTPCSLTWAGSDRRDLQPHRTLADYLKAVKPPNVRKPDLVLCYFNDKNAWQYPELKIFGDVTAATATQGLDISKAKVRDPQRGNPQYYGNVALKVNAKLGGSNQVLNRADMGVLFKQSTMVLGADVTHPSPDSANPSVAAVVGSTSEHGMGYHAEFSVQMARQEMMAELDVMVLALLKRFQTTNKRLPQNVVFYRDGISDGQFKTCLAEEIPLLRKAFRQIDPTWKPRLTFLICGKRHHFKFSPVNPNDADRSGNLKPGVVVDTDIVHPFDFDWYCQSHAGLLGTSRSAHYTVLVDDSKLSADDLQTLTYNLCYLYSRATRSVSIATPAYYAHHVCTRAKLWLAQPDADDSTTFSGSTTARREAEAHLLADARNRANELRTTFNARSQSSVEFWM